MSNPGLIKTKTAEGVIAPYRIVKHGTVDGNVLQAAAGGDFLLGATLQLANTVSGDRVDICMGGQPEIEYGGAVTRGNPLTSDANGMAVAASPAAGVNKRIIGFALVSGIAGDIVAFQFAPGQIQG